MRILFNGIPIRGNLTGIGQYSLSLLSALVNLVEREGRDEIGVFNSRTIRPARDFLASLNNAAGPVLHSSIKHFLRRFVPVFSGRVSRLRHRWHLARATGGSHWDCYHETNYVSASNTLPLITTVHDMGYLRHPQFLPRERLDWLRRGMPGVLARSRAIVADSHFTRNEILELCPRVDPDRVAVAHLGVDLATLTDPAQEHYVEQARRQYALPRRFVLYLGTLEPRKNLQGLLAGYRRLPGDLQAEYPLVLAGMAGWNLQSFAGDAGYLRTKGVLHEIGYVDRSLVPALLTAASVFCFPSLYEGFGLPPLEAAACGTPVLSSNTGSLPEVLGDAALYVNPTEPDEMAAALVRLLEDHDLRRSLSLAGPARAATFSWESCARQTLAIYRKAA